MSIIRIGLNEDGSLDEFVARNVSVHFEAMGESQFWILVRDGDSGLEYTINCGALNPRAHGYAMVEVDT